MMKPTNSSSWSTQMNANNDGKSLTPHNAAVDMMYRAVTSESANEKSNLIRSLHLLIVHKHPKLLDNFFDEMLGFRHDNSVKVKVCVVRFAQDACLRDAEFIPQVVACLQQFLADKSIAVTKSGIRAAAVIYQKTLFKLIAGSSISDELVTSWNTLVAIKNQVVKYLDEHRESVKMQALKFMETLILAHAECVEVVNDDSKPQTRECPLKKSKIENDGLLLFEQFLTYYTSKNIRFMNVMAATGALVNIAKRVSKYMGKVVTALEVVVSSLPDDLTDSQTASTRKYLKQNLLSLLECGASSEFQTRLSSILSELGATQSEIKQHLPLQESDDGAPPAKRPKLDDLTMSEDDFLPVKDTQTITDGMAQEIIPLLTPVNVVDIIIKSSINLPSEFPDLFAKSYKPIADAGSEQQIQHLARLLATQFITAGLGVIHLRMEQERAAGMEDVESTDGVKKSKGKKPIVLPADGVDGLPARCLKQIKLSEITKPLTSEQMDEVTSDALSRIIGGCDSAFLGGGRSEGVQYKLLAWLGTYFGIKIPLKEYFLREPRKSIELILMWLYEQYCCHKGFTMLSQFKNLAGSQQYEEVFIGVLQEIRYTSHHQRGYFYTRIYLECPYLTDAMLNYLAFVCEDEGTVDTVMNLFQELIIRRPGKQLDSLNILMQLAHHLSAQIRQHVLATIRRMYGRGILVDAIEEYATMYLKFLLLNEPAPDELPHTVRACGGWTPELIAVYMNVYLALLPMNHRLIHELADVFIAAPKDRKKIILLTAQNVIRSIGMDSVELLQLISDCPKGAEGLVIRILRLITEKSSPSLALVARVRDVYVKRFNDVRILIPVLSGLSKKEVITALPKLIRFTQPIVRLTFRRLLGSYSFDSVGPLSPVELMVALHNLADAEKDMKAIIQAMNICFQEKDIFSPDVLTSVIQQLLEKNPIPNLLLRTILQSVSLYPRLLTFTINTLQQLVMKHIWTDHKLWDGFIKCCQLTKPHSFSVILRLPTFPMQEFFDRCPDLKEPICRYAIQWSEKSSVALPLPISNLIDELNCCHSELGGEREPPPPGTMSPMTDRISQYITPLMLQNDAATAKSEEEPSSEDEELSSVSGGKSFNNGPYERASTPKNGSSCRMCSTPDFPSPIV